MRIHLVKKKTISEYVIKNRNSQLYFDKWLNTLRLADWKEPADIRFTFSSVDFLGNTHRVVFNIGGNKYRMISSYKFGNKQVHLFIKWIGTHDEYNSLCDKLETLVFNQGDQDEIDLLTQLIEKYDKKYSKEIDMNPIELLESLMEDHGIEVEDLTEILDLDYGAASQILNYEKNLSKRSIEKLADHFKLRSEAFNHPYELKKEKNIKRNN